MRVFNSQMHLLTFVFIVLEFGMLVFYQLPHYLSRREDRSRGYYLVLLVLLLVYNVSCGLMPDPQIPLPVKWQNILAYGSGFMIASYFPYFFYKSLQLDTLRYHACFGVPICIVLPYLVFFTGYYLITEDFSVTIRWGLLIPFLYSFIILRAILRAIRLKYLTENPNILVRRWEALTVYCAVLPWVCLSVFVYFEVRQWIEMLFTNLGFILATAAFIIQQVNRRKSDASIIEQFYQLQQQTDPFEQNLKRFSFSSRELEIIYLLRQGLGKKRIADELFIATATVSRHVQNIYNKAKVRTRLELLRKLESFSINGDQAQLNQI
ncbi:helix-turn-helix transcriptional regulator [Pedobacter aquatilis]|uniref:helix-turn-helix transcriptional regulator n=1 Tax=Pedobacter aquatilis TaxID=351343 RepID=UPI00292DE76A|nr:helix-turn-helix transcriptional regulator [Pedobacter aquatilis]